MAAPKQWGEVRRAWRALLNEFGVEVFHMTDFENRQGEFLNWDEDKKRSLLSRLVGNLVEHVALFYGASVVVKDFNGIRDDVKQTLTSRRLMDPWYLCYQSCFEDALSTYSIFDPEWAGIEPKFENIRACFFEQHREYIWGPMLFTLAQETAQEQGLQRPIGIVGWGDKRSSIHLQVADLIAYEVRKHVENAIFNGGRPTRWPMKQLLKNMFMMSTFDNSRTSIPIEGSETAYVKTAALHGMDENGRIRFNI